MENGRVLLFYHYASVQYPQQVAKWQRRLCTDLQLTGRIIIAHEGINGTVGGSYAATEAYSQALRQHELFGTIDIKESAGSSADFPRLCILIKREICQLGIDPEKLSATDCGTYVSPAQAHQMLATKSDALVVLDVRNAYESEIGQFEGAVLPNTQNFRDFPNYIDTNLEQFRDKEVLMYCTGGIRCVRASAYLKVKHVAKKVYHIAGGIHRYVEQFPNGFFRGKNYVFDRRKALPVTQDVLGKCHECQAPHDRHHNCLHPNCPLQVLVCTPCAARTSYYCNAHKTELVTVTQPTPSSQGV